MAFTLKKLNTERDALIEKLREIEAEQRQLEGEMKGVRQRELRTKREIEALSTLIELSADEAAQKPSASATGAASKKTTAKKAK